VVSAFVVTDADQHCSPLHVMSTSCSLCTVTPSFVKIDIVPSSDILPTLISELGKSSNESVLAARSDSCLNGRRLTCLAVVVPLLATPTCFVDGHANIYAIVFAEVMAICT